MTCCFCGKVITGYGNDPQPLVDNYCENRCCDECNANVVIPERIKRLTIYKQERV